jgi:hypothetical protein
MRSVSETLEAAQSSNKRIPYIHLVFTSYDGLTTYDLSTDNETYGFRILLIDHFEEPYNDYATIMLANFDGSLPNDLRGYWTDIGYGDVTGNGDEYVETSRLWVKKQQPATIAGKYVIILSLEGKWAKLRETLMRLGDPPYYISEYTEDTIFDIIGYVLAEIDPAMSLQELGDQDDSIIDTYVPPFGVNTVNFDDAASIVYTLLKMTKCFLRPKAGLDFEVRFLQDDDNHDAEYDITQFYEWSGGLALTVPNQVILFANAGADQLWTSIITKTSDNAESQAQYGVAPTIALAPEITDPDDAQNRADAVLTRIKAETFVGQLIMPHNCMHELYDFIQVDIGRV